MCAQNQTIYGTPVPSHNAAVVNFSTVSSFFKKPGYCAYEIEVEEDVDSMNGGIKIVINPINKLYNT